MTASDLAKQNIQAATTYMQLQACRRMIDRMIQGSERINLLREIAKKEKSLRNRLQMQIIYNNKNTKLCKLF